MREQAGLESFKVAPAVVATGHADDPAAQEILSWIGSLARSVAQRAWVWKTYSGSDLITYFYSAQLQPLSADR